MCQEKKVNPNMRAKPPYGVTVSLPPRRRGKRRVALEDGAEAAAGGSVRKSPRELPWVLANVFLLAPGGCINSKISKTVSGLYSACRYLSRTWQVLG